MSVRYSLLIGLLAAMGCRHIDKGFPLVPPPNVNPSSGGFVFEAIPAVIGPGEESFLRWNIQGANRVSIEESTAGGKLHLIGDFGGVGTLRVLPQKDSAYVISCEGNPTISCASVSVRVRVKEQ